MRKRKTIEIYFVLYLAALILLLPHEDKKNNGSDDENLHSFQPPFSLQLDKTMLICKFSNDSSGRKIIALDSVNRVFYAGDVENVRFEFTIEDRSTNRILPLITDSVIASKSFRIEEHSNLQAAFFYWTPSNYDLENKTYIVNVLATGFTKNNNHDSRNQNQLINNPVLVKTQFSLTIINKDEYSNFVSKQASSTIGNFSGLFNNFPTFRYQTSQNSDIIIEPKEQSINTIAYQNWSNDVFVSGLNLTTDLQKQPEIKIIRSHLDNGGSALISEIVSNKLTIVGTAPSYGTLKVQILITRKSDGQKVSSEFFIYLQPLSPPEYDKVMYPFKKYMIKPNMPFTTGLDTKAYLKDGNTIRASSPQGTDFAFSPSITDTGKVMYLEIYVNDKLFGQRYPIQVNNYPDPEIIRLNVTDEGVVMVQTRSYGLFNGKENYVRLEIIEGNANIFEPVGLTKSNYLTLIHLQTFRLSPKNTSKPFNFTVRAVDQRGRKSNIKSYPED